VTSPAPWKPRSRRRATAEDHGPRGCDPGDVKRSPELAPLSRDHHVALEHALRLRRATSEDIATVVARFLAFFVADGERHFAREEELLLPAVPADEAPARERLLTEHEEIRRRARALEDRPDRAAAADLGELLAAHVRFEERELFPMLEARLPAPELIELGRRLDA
jgi:hemerythrin-like domain-containing protein